MSTADDSLREIAQAWWRMQGHERSRISETISGSELARLLDRVVASHRGDDRMCVCLMPQHGHDMQCPARKVKP